MAKRSDTQYLGDIVDHGREALAIVAGITRDHFFADRTTQSRWRT